MGRFFAWLGRALRYLFAVTPKKFREHFEAYFGADFRELQTHDKSFPGYDIASLNRALASFFQDVCTGLREIGSCQAVQSLRQLIDNPYLVNSIPPPAVHERVPVNVGEEASFVANCLYLATMRPVDGGTERKIAVFLSANLFAQDYWDSPSAQNVPMQQIKLSVACRSREDADRVFREVEERRKRLSIFRGKVIDPVVGSGGVHTVGFRAIQPVEEGDLILPESVKALVKSSILGFCRHSRVLQSMGVELKRGVLFHGPPGTGKTSISMYLAKQLPQFTVCFVSGERLLYPREICRMARYLQPAMIVFEDIDLVASDRSANGLATVLGELMNQIDGCEPDDQVLFIMNTNSLDRLEHAVKNRPGRVDQIIQIPLPDADERRQLLARFARGLRLEQTDLSEFIDATDGATPAVLKEIVKRAAVGAVVRADAANDGQEIVVGTSDLMLAVEQVRAQRDAEVVPGSFGFREKPR